MKRALLAAAVLFALVGCQPAENDPDVADTLAAPAGQDTATAPSEAGGAVVALDIGGLRLVNAASGSTRPLDFGMDEADIVGMLTDLRGEPDRHGLNPECSAGPLSFTTWADGLTLYGSDGEFAGWFVDARAEGSNDYTTLAGIGTGSTLADVESAYDITMNETSVGPLFDAGNLFGILDGTSPEATVTHLWSGVACVFF